MPRPKQCAGCKKPATIHLTQIVDNKIFKVDMCEDCVYKDTVVDPSLSLGQLLPGGGEAAAAAMDPGVSCPACGANHQTLQETGRFGCPECYHTFAEAIEASLLKVQAGHTHEGKRPQVLESRRARQEQLRTLQEELSKAVASEHFEQAAQLRDRIRELSA